MLGPVHAVGNQCNRRLVDRMDRTLEALWQFAVAASLTKTRRLILTMVEHLPKEILCPGGIASAVGMRECVASRSGRSSNRGELACVILEPVTDVIKTESSRHLVID
jgi:hypothetical protein